MSVATGGAFSCALAVPLAKLPIATASASTPVAEGLGGRSGLHAEATISDDINRTSDIGPPQWTIRWAPLAHCPKGVGAGEYGDGARFVVLPSLACLWLAQVASSATCGHGTSPTQCPGEVLPSAQDFRQRRPRHQPIEVPGGAWPRRHWVVVDATPNAHVPAIRLTSRAKVPARGGDIRKMAAPGRM